MTPDYPNARADTQSTIIVALVGYSTYFFGTRQIIDLLADINYQLVLNYMYKIVGFLVTELQQFNIYS